MSAFGNERSFVERPELGAFPQLNSNRQHSPTEQSGSYDIGLQFMEV